MPEATRGSKSIERDKWSRYGEKTAEPDGHRSLEDVFPSLGGGREKEEIKSLPEDPRRKL